MHRGFFPLIISLFISLVQNSMAKEFITNPDRNDGFGAQFQTIIYSAIYAELKGLEFVYTPFNKMEHNYDGDPKFIAKKEELINFIDQFETNRYNTRRADVWEVIHFFEGNLEQCAKSKTLQQIKNLFRANKNRDHYFDNEHFHIVIHVRRPNSHDCRLDGADTPDNFFLAIIDKLRTIYASQNPLFHLHSQGESKNFIKFICPDVVLHLNESTEDSFTSMVLADALVISRSSFSYTAGILSDGVVYYIPFWHPPLPGWIVTNIK